MFGSTAITQRTTSAQIVMDLLTPGGRLPVSANLSHSSLDPFAVRVVFAVQGCPPVEWVFARELLVDGLRQPAGLGDVRVFPGEGTLIIDLESPDGTARLAAPLASVADFVTRSVTAVPLGAELAFVDLEAAVEALAVEAMADQSEI